MIRLHKVLAYAGISSRRGAEEMIRAGRVKVNGQVVGQMGTQVDPGRDKIQVDEKSIRVERKRYIVLHKPRGYLSDLDEERGKPLAVDLVSIPERLYPAGRLDANSEGLLLLTNDGEFAHRITHPRYQHEKEYLVLVEGEPRDEALRKLVAGVWVSAIPVKAVRGDRAHVRARRATLSEKLRADRVERAGRQQRFGNADRGQTWLRVILHEGKKRQVRRMCAAVGHRVLRLVRTRIGAITLDSLRPRQWRELGERELTLLKGAIDRTRRVELSHSQLRHRD